MYNNHLEKMSKLTEELEYIADMLEKKAHDMDVSKKTKEHVLALSMDIAEQVHNILEEEMKKGRGNDTYEIAFKEVVKYLSALYHEQEASLNILATKTELRLMNIASLCYQLKIEIFAPKRVLLLNIKTLIDQINAYFQKEISVP